MNIPDAAWALYAEYGSALGASPGAIEKKIRRLVNSRERQRNKSAERATARSKAFANAYRQQFGKEPTSLLTEAVTYLDETRQTPDADI